MITYKSMVVSGDFKLIENFNIREKLIDLEENYSALKINEDMYIDFVMNDLVLTLTDNFDLSQNKVINKDCFAKFEYRNLVFLFKNLNINRLDQYKASMEKARNAHKAILNEMQE